MKTRLKSFLGYGGYKNHVGQSAPTILKSWTGCVCHQKNGSYRPICQLGFLAKNLKAMLEASVWAFAEKNALFSDSQYRFRQHR